MARTGNCNNVKGLRHRVYWNFKEPRIDEESLSFGGECIVCRTEFETTYDLRGNTIISKSTREALDFNFEIDEPQLERINN